MAELVDADLAQRPGSSILNNVPTLKDRRSGILLHISSLPGPYYCGDLGKAAYQFADFLISSGQSWWQVLPLNPIGLGNSPYSTTCSFAGEPLFIDFENLVQDGLLKKSEITEPKTLSSSRVYYSKARQYRKSRMQRAYQRFCRNGNESDSEHFQRFLTAQHYWLDDFALFCVLADKFGTRNWSNWPPGIRKRKPSVLADLRKDHKAEMTYIKFLQYKFFTQWGRLKTYLNHRGIGLIGDIPLFVGYRSSDVWAAQEYFELNRDGSPKFVAGVPPDYYCPEGQLWGNPLYNWPAIKKNEFSWWVERIKHLMALFDVLRLDHFIGFYRYWVIEAEAKTARDGRFRKTPGRELLQTLRHKLGELSFIAEDLGTVVPGVYKLRDEFDLPGMRVLQFGFGNEPSAKYHLPFSYSHNTAVYTGTHDNNTVVGWYDEAKKETRKKKKTVDFSLLAEYFDTGGSNIHWQMIREAMKSAANISIFPMQDILGLDQDARMNTPGIPTGNWRWRLEENAPTADLAARLRKETQTFSRLP
jgi:4-alpha-glucanotransferase